MPNFIAPFTERQPPDPHISTSFPIFHPQPYPRMPATHPTHSPFLDRIHRITLEWVQQEWFILNAIKHDARCNGWSPATLKAVINDNRLTPDNLAKRLDNISQATLRRELKRLHAPCPGQIIRTTRVAFAKHLLTTTRLLVRDISIRAGYDNEKSFTRTFLAETGCSPRAFRTQNVTAKLECEP